MLQRLYVHNFRCLENFELSLKGMSSALLIGKNGVGKSTIASALEVLQSIGRGINRVGQLVRAEDFALFVKPNFPIRFEIELLLDGKLYEYTLALEKPENFGEFRVFEEQLLVAGELIYSREKAQVTLASQNREAQFLVDWHLIALPVIQVQSETDPLHIFKTWLARMIILAPIPSLMTGESKGETKASLRDNRGTMHQKILIMNSHSDNPRDTTNIENKSLKDVIELVESWMADESGYDEETYPQIEAALNQNRV